MDSLDTFGLSDALLYDVMLYVVVGVLLLVGIVIALKARRWRAASKGRRSRKHRYL